MKHEHVSLSCETGCPFCGTTVPSGVSVCAGCGAIYCIRKRIGRLGVSFFVVGLFLGYTLSSDHMLPIALFVSAVGAFSMNVLDARKPFWLRYDP